MSWETLEHPRDLRYKCDRPGCGFEMYASVVDPLAGDIVDQHEVSHTFAAPVWAHAHAAFTPPVWNPRERVGWSGWVGAVLFTVGVVGLVFGMGVLT